MHDYSHIVTKFFDANSGKDQNWVLDAMRYGRGEFGLRYAYFSNSTAILMDKMVGLYSKAIELGGAASAELLENLHSIAMHATCYEQSTKVRIYQHLQIIST